MQYKYVKIIIMKMWSILHCNSNRRPHCWSWHGVGAIVGLTISVSWGWLTLHHRRIGVARKGRRHNCRIIGKGGQIWKCKAVTLSSDVVYMWLLQPLSQHNNVGKYLFWLSSCWQIWLEVAFPVAGTWWDLQLVGSPSSSLHHYHQLTLGLETPLK